MRTGLKPLMIVLCILMLLSLSGCYEDDRYTNANGSKVAEIKFTDEFADNTLKPAYEEYLKNKYDEEFTVTYIEPTVSFYLCKYYGEVTANESGQRFEIFCSYYEDETVTCEDNYFYYTIKDEYEQYMSDIISEVFPEHKIDRSYSFSRFLDVKKKINFDEFLEKYMGDYSNSVDFLVYIKDSELTDSDEQILQLSAALKNINFSGNITIHRFPDEIYDNYEEPLKEYNDSYIIIKCYSDSIEYAKSNWEKEIYKPPLRK
ncbi:MAG: hypothetical protein HDR03_10825 [Lachnospiraceae bacterium]|nr:hypothetical protein [Lachnospiraceae bacterium]